MVEIACIYLPTTFERYASLLKFNPFESSQSSLSRDARKVVFRISDQISQKPVCEVTEAA